MDALTAILEHADTIAKYGFSIGGWVAFGWLLREYLRLQRETLTAMHDTTAALNLLAAKLGG